MKTTFEIELIQNTAVGATALWQFSAAYLKASGAIAPDLPRVLIVLPIVFHRESARVIAPKHFKSGLMKALYDAPDLVVGLQARMEAMYDRTLRSLLLACSNGLLERVSSSNSFPKYRIARKTLPEALRPVHDDVRQMLNASKRLGSWFAGHDIGFLCSNLHIRF